MECRLQPAIQRITTKQKNGVWGVAPIRIRIADALPRLIPTPLPYRTMIMVGMLGGMFPVAHVMALKLRTLKGLIGDPELLNETVGKFPSTFEMAENTFALRLTKHWSTLLTTTR
ncbi:hypothetical protein CJ255_19830 [Candidatus Viridilinea mediisalina]|uniref:Uncharacterized protein n=1 Tax=Candidatus Viridilinea mediisalina TaxID=2024553 RepID=A0A2A6RE06_9CHLR|nr:hypothetical protein CJ255_19830 [Candidatus Viridilinea mediisalina]